MALSLTSEPLGSLSLSGSNYVNTTTSSAFTLGTGDFTIEYWIYMTNVTGTKRIMGNVTAADNAGFQMDTNGTGISIGSWSTATYYTVTPSLSAVFLNQWVHVAWVRISGVEYLYLNGTLLASVTRSINFTGTGGVYLGVVGSFNTNFPMVGNMSNFRIVKGVGVYTGNFTPPVQPLTGTQSAGTNISAVTGTQTSLLTQTPNNANFLKDSSVNNLTFTNTGTVTASALTPFLLSNTVTWQITSNPLGSLNFNGTSQYLTVPSTTAFAMSTGSFTVEGWVYLTAYPAGGVANGGLFGTAGGSPALSGYYLNLGQDINTLRVTSNASGSWQDDITVTTGNGVPLNTWTHLAMVRNGDSLVLYKNGVSVASRTGVSSWNYSSASNNGYVGYSNDGSGTIRFVTGYITNVRVVKGVAVYTGNFIVPTQPLLGQQSAGTNISAITGTQTSLLLQTPNNAAFITDSSANNITLTNNGTTPAAALNPFDFKPLGSVNFNGTNQSLTTTVATSSALDLATGAGNWTVECWFYATSLAVNGSIFWKTAGANPSYAFFLSGSSSQWIVGDGAGGGTAITPSTVFAVNTWYHFALVRNGSSLTSYTNGVQSGTTTMAFVMGNGGASTTLYTGAAIDGRFFPGYISNLRVTKGVAVYTGNFTPPSTPLPISQTAGTNISAITGTQTSLLLQTPNSVGFISDSSSYNFAMTNNNTATASGLTPLSFVPGFGWQMTS
jgi:hypothetical protein